MHPVSQLPAWRGACCLVCKVLCVNLTVLFSISHRGPNKAGVVNRCAATFRKSRKAVGKVTVIWAEIEKSEFKTGSGVHHVQAHADAAVRRVEGG
jgi:glutamine phosphoribosylpyrophosphate amidotransferase